MEGEGKGGALSRGLVLYYKVLGHVLVLVYVHWYWHMSIGLCNIQAGANGQGPSPDAREDAYVH